MKAEPTQHDNNVEKEGEEDVVGLIAERRSMGRNLAFVELQMMSSTRSLVFRRATGWTDDNGDWDAFPLKSTALPYGARIRCRIRPSSRSGKHKEATRTPLYEVVAWKILEHPKEVAIELATNDEEKAGGGISNTEYFRARASNCLRHQHDQYKTTTKQQRNSLSVSHDDAPSPKASRSRVFANFVIDNVLDTATTDCVLDIAGGKGHLSIEIALQSKLQCYIVDPVVRKQWPKKFSKRLAAASAPIPQFISQRFDVETAMDVLAQTQHSNDALPTPAPRSTMCFVGLHPDEPTELIVDTALALDCSFAVVPCCVFPSLFPLRTLRTTPGRTVQTYDEFVTYLMEKDSRTQRATLGFEGKNQVIYLQAKNREECSKDSTR